MSSCVFGICGLWHGVSEDLVFSNAIRFRSGVFIFNDYASWVRCSDFGLVLSALLGDPLSQRAEERRDHVETRSLECVFAVRSLLLKLLFFLQGRKI